MLLVFALLGGCAAPQAVGAQGSDGAEPTPAATERPKTGKGLAIPAMAVSETRSDGAVGTETITRSDGVHADTHYDDMHWEIYDMTEFKAQAERLSNTTDPAEAEELYRWLMDEYLRISTWSQLAWIDFYASEDEDGSIGKACEALDQALTEAGDVLQTAASHALEQDNSGDFGVYLGEAVAEELADYEEMSDREAELWNRETELVLEYNALLERDDLSEPALNYRMGTVFLELVRVRNELAEIYEYDSYAEFAYEMIFCRDFTPEDAAALSEAIKPYARRYYQDCYYSGVFQETIGEFSAGELMDLLREYAPRISPRAAEAQAYMEEHGLYLLESMDLVAPLGFTATLAMYNAPFLYNSLYGEVYDVMDTFHEFGHYYDAYVNPEPDPMFVGGSYDIFEIHSTSMEALLYGWYDEIFGEDAEKAKIYCLDSLMSNVVSGCIYDEFLQYVCAHPDMTVDEVNQAYYEIASSYGMGFFNGSMRYYWMYVNHNFESPFYYISYSVSALAALQIWALAEQDRDAAIALYNEMIDYGAYDYEYCELLKTLGLHVFTEDLDACIRDAYAQLEDLCFRYEMNGLAA